MNLLWIPIILTKSGSITPAVDFEHLSTVLVITDLKQQVDESQADATEEDTLLDETTETEWEGQKNR